MSKYNRANSQFRYNYVFLYGEILYGEPSSKSKAAPLMANWIKKIRITLRYLINPVVVKTRNTSSRGRVRIGSDSGAKHKKKVQIADKSIL